MSLPFVRLNNHPIDRMHDHLPGRCVLIVNYSIFVAFSIFYVFHGLLREKKYELYVLILAILVVMVYCIVEYIVNVTGRSTLKLVC